MERKIERLSRSDLDRLVRGRRAGLQTIHKILRDFLMDDPDLVDSVHNAPNLRHRSPRVLILVVQPVEPLLNFKRFDVLCNLTAPFRDKDVANVVLKNGFRVLRLWTGCDLGIKLNLEVVLRKLIELDPTCARIGAVDPDAKVVFHKSEKSYGWLSTRRSADGVPFFSSRPEQRALPRAYCLRSPRITESAHPA